MTYSGLLSNCHINDVYICDSSVYLVLLFLINDVIENKLTDLPSRTTRSKMANSHTLLIIPKHEWS